MTTPAALDLTADPDDLTATLVDIPSVSGTEEPLADLIEAALRALPHLEVLRSWQRGAGPDPPRPADPGAPGRPHRHRADRRQRAVPQRGRPDPRLRHHRHEVRRRDDAHLAATLPEPSRDLTFVFYDCEEIEHERNGLTRIERELPDWLTADLAILGEPTNGAVEAGCQGTAAVEVRLTGRRAHSARSWLGTNAIHAAAPVLARLAEYPGRDVDIDGCVYREGLNAVRINGGVAGNVIPDECVVQVNFRFAPDRDADDALAFVKTFFDGFDVRVLDIAPGARPGLAAPAAAEFVAAAGGTAVAKYGWTDVARFATLGIPAVNYGPGDPSLAHTREEHVSRQQIREMAAVLRTYLS